MINRRTGLSGIHLSASVALPVWLLIISFGGRLEAGQKQGHPRLKLSAAALNYGKCGHSKYITKRITLTNSGTATLTITKLRESCSCTKCNLSKYSLPPGDSAQLSVRLSTGRIMGFLRKYIEIHSNLPGRPVFRIPILADIHGETKAEPWILPRFTAVAEGKPVKQNLILKWRKHKRCSLSLRNLRSESENVSLRKVPIKREDSEGPITGYRIEIKVKPPSKEGPFSTTIAGQLNGKYWESPLRGYVFSGIVVSPRYFQFGKIEDPGKTESTIELKTADGAPFRILSIKSEPAILCFQTKSLSGGKKHLVTAGVSARDRSRRFFAGVEIRTDHPKKPLIKVVALGFWAPKTEKNPRE